MAFGKQHSVATAKRPVPPPQKPGGPQAATNPGGAPDPDDNMPPNPKRAKGNPPVPPKTY
jgi:hypothetical protein